MKFFKYIRRSAARNKLRTILTVLSVGFSLAMLTVLYGYLVMQDAWTVEAAKHHRVVVMNIQGFSGDVPIAYVDRVRGMPGAVAAVPFLWYGGIYQNETTYFAQFATDAEWAFKVWDEYQIAPEQLGNWQGEPQGCVVDRRMAQRRGWKIGTRIPLQGNIYPFDLDLVVCGFYDAPQPDDSLWFHWKYLDEGLKQMHAEGSGNCGTIFVKAASPEVVPRLCQAIDDRFASSENPTRTQTESAFAQMFTNMLGDIESYIRNISLAVIFSLSLVAATAMAMSLRERTTEIAVLKAIGFRRRRVLWIILVESCLISLAGGLLGVLVGCISIDLFHYWTPQFFRLGLVDLAGPWLANGLMVATAIGVISGLVPALRAAQLSVVDGLRRVV